MSIGFSLFLIAVGAILRYAVTWEPSGVDLETVGLILMIVLSALATVLPASLGPRADPVTTPEGEAAAATEPANDWCAEHGFEWKPKGTFHVN